MSDPKDVTWRTSSRSGANGQCVEVSERIGDSVAVRDSKDRAGAMLTFSAGSWRSFTRGLRRDR